MTKLTSEYLNAQDLHQLTGYARPVKQLGWLQAHGIPHRADGSRIIVSHKHVTSWLEGRNVIQSSGPNWSAVK
jgi:hypothetical protein